MRPTGSGGGLSPRTFAARPGAIFARFAGSGFAAVRVRPARAAESGVGAGREFPECPGKGRGKTIAPSATGKAFFRPPVRIRRVRANAARNARARCLRPRSAAGSIRQSRRRRPRHSRRAGRVRAPHRRKSRARRSPSRTKAMRLNEINALSLIAALGVLLFADEPFLLCPLAFRHR